MSRRAGWAEAWRPNPLLLSTSARMEGWLWLRRPLYALLGWVFVLFPERQDPRDQDLADVLVFLACVTFVAFVFAARAFLLELR